jgi:hypothetical protein
MSNPEDFIGHLFVASHPDMYRKGHPARIEAVVMMKGRRCFRLRYPDGVEDYAPIENEDFVGKGSQGVFYEITKEMKMPTEERKKELEARIAQIKKVLDITKQAMNLVHEGMTESRGLLYSNEVGKGLEMARDYLRSTQKILIVNKYDDELELMP